MRSLCGCALLVVLIGCGGGDGEIAPISGTVTLNGEPLPDATVTFRPKSTKADAGPSSFGRTDADGHYELEVMTDGRTGAVPGVHQVMITVSQDEEEQDMDVNSNDALRVIPLRYNRETTLEFDVTPEGSTEADFVLESR